MIADSTCTEYISRPLGGIFAVIPHINGALSTLGRPIREMGPNRPRPDSGKARRMASTVRCLINFIVDSVWSTLETDRGSVQEARDGCSGARVHPVLIARPTAVVPGQRPLKTSGYLVLLPMSAESKPCGLQRCLTPTLRISTKPLTRCENNVVFGRLSKWHTKPNEVAINFRRLSFD